MKCLHLDKMCMAAMALVLMLAAGCDYLAFTDTQLIKIQMREYSLAVSARDWRTVAGYYDASFRWQQGRGAVLQGRGAAKAFTGTLNAMHNMNEFFVICNDTRKVKPDLVEAAVIMQAHIVLSSMEMNYTNTVWKARMGWVKRGPGKWLIAYIHETTPRKDGKFSRL